MFDPKPSAKASKIAGFFRQVGADADEARRTLLAMTKSAEKEEKGKKGDGDERPSGAEQEILDAFVNRVIGIAQREGHHNAEWVAIQASVTGLGVPAGSQERAMVLVRQQVRSAARSYVKAELSSGAGQRKVLRAWSDPHALRRAGPDDLVALTGAFDHVDMLLGALAAGPDATAAFYDAGALSIADIVAALVPAPAIAAPAVPVPAVPGAGWQSATPRRR